MFHPNTLRFIQWWRGLPSGNGAPPRSAVEPRDLVSVLPQVFMLDGAAAFRLAGGLVCDLHGRELRDGLLLELFDKPDRARVWAALEHAGGGADPVVIQAEGRPLTGPGVGMELTVAPLASIAGGEADRLIGLYQPLGLLAKLCGRPVQSLSLRRIHPETAANDTRLRLVALNGRRIA